ncbi:glycoside hydrolase family 28 protein [Erythrobacter sp. SN021]|uniref:glycoside hydrolase family 28 protein n=1 Tax=Erythrobacter sp. SN021 TaxID=2912574 RepID=UPI001F196FE5|nr:glycoside hydrolase family 28 protein [Erythrobacter sp. SN021]MCF8882717.1 glycoside hydrolase family 28 protein [Erythrobacter sp. SN021]
MNEEYLTISRRTLLASSLLAGGSVIAAGCVANPVLLDDPSWLDNPWSRADRIVGEIGQVEIPARQFAITEFGALDNDGSDARPAIQSAIAAAHAAGGGRVIIPSGLWLSDGPIHYRSNVELHLAEGAHLRFLPNVEQYLPPVRTRWEGTELYTYSPMLYAENCENIALTGSGTVDGQGEQYWLPWRDTQRPIQRLLRDMGRDGVPVEERLFVGERRLRPYFVQFNRCRRVLVDGPRLIDSPFWMVHPLFCEDVIIRNIRCKSDHVNSDGVDPDSSRRVLIENCDFDVGDDGVSLKSGRDQDGWRVGIPTENVVVRNCTYSGSAGGGMAIGSEMSGGVRNIFVDGYDLPRAVHTLYFKANLDRGGLISDIYIRNINAGETQSLLVFTNDYHSYRGGNYPPQFERVLIESVQVDRTVVGISIDGHENAPVRDVVIRNLTMGEAEFPLKVSNAERITLDRVLVGGRALTMADAIPVDSGQLGGY